MTTDFHGSARDLGFAAAAHQRPLTFVLGAGASLSSGAPTTPAMHERLVEATKGRVKGPLRDHLHELVRREVRDHLRPLFRDVTPDVGYRLLASLARWRRVNVVTLNWDTAAEQACDAAGVPYASFDPLRDGSLADHVAALPDDRGVLIVHAHGRIDDDARYATLDTLPNRPEILEAVMPLLLHDTIICGASLQGDLDVAEVLQRLRDSDRDGAAVWLFSRGGAQPIVEPPPTWRRVEAADVDFDDLMIVVAEEVMTANGFEWARWSDLRDALPELGLPDNEQLIEMPSKIRRRALGASVVALVGRPLSGKSVTGMRLTHLRRLIDGIAEPVSVVMDPQEAPSALAAAVRRGGVATLIDDPFGQGEPQTNPLVADLLGTLADDGRAFACICSRSANWGAETTDLRIDGERIYVAPRDYAEWYGKGDLLRLANTVGKRKAARRAVHLDHATTPYEVVYVGRHGGTPSLDEWIAAQRRLLEQQRPLALLAALVRLQQLRSMPVPEAELQVILRCPPSEVDGADELLVRFPIDGQMHWRFNHPTSREAADAWIADHFDELQDVLCDAAVVPMWSRRCLAGWALQHGMDASAVAELDPEEHLDPADWMAERLGVDPSEELLSSLPSRPRDAWATIEYTNVLVRVWERVSSSPTARRLLEHLIESPMGVYALLEACLTLGLGTDDELWGRLVDRLYALSHDPQRARERLLALNAVAWLPPDYAPVAAWAERMIEEMSPDAPEFGLVRFARAYYPDGLARLGVEQALDADVTRGWSEQQAEVAATLVAWHFAHQSRARVLLLRTDKLDQQRLCQEFTPTTEAAHLDARLALIGSLAQSPRYAGWGFHIACNLAVVDGLDLREERVRGVVAGALDAAPPVDSGVISAALAYRSSDVFSRELRDYFRSRDAQNALLDAMAHGIDAMPGIEVQPPRFRYLRSPEAVHAVSGLRWETLDPALPRRPDALASGLFAAASRILDGASATIRRAAAVVIGQVERGDFRPVESFAPRRGRRDDDPFERALRASLAHMNRRRAAGGAAPRWEPGPQLTGRTRTPGSPAAPTGASSSPG